MALKADSKPISYWLLVGNRGKSLYSMKADSKPISYWLLVGNRGKSLYSILPYSLLRTSKIKLRSKDSGILLKRRYGDAKNSEMPLAP